MRIIANEASTVRALVRPSLRVRRYAWVCLSGLVLGALVAIGATFARLPTGLTVVAWLLAVVLAAAPFVRTRRVGITIDREFVHPQAGRRSKGRIRRADVTAVHYQAGHGEVRGAGDRLLVAFKPYLLKADLEEMAGYLDVPFCEFGPVVVPPAPNGRRRRPRTEVDWAPDALVIFPDVRTLAATVYILLLSLFALGWSTIGIWSAVAHHNTAGFFALLTWLFPLSIGAYCYYNSGVVVEGDLIYQTIYGRNRSVRKDQVVMMVFRGSGWLWMQNADGKTILAIERTILSRKQFEQLAEFVGCPFKVDRSMRRKKIV